MCPFAERAHLETNSNGASELSSSGEGGGELRI